MVIGRADGGDSKGAYRLRCIWMVRSSERKCGVRLGVSRIVTLRLRWQNFRIKLIRGGKGQRHQIAGAKPGQHRSTASRMSSSSRPCRCRPLTRGCYFGSMNCAKLWGRRLQARFFESTKLFRYTCRKRTEGADFQAMPGSVVAFTFHQGHAGMVFHARFAGGDYRLTV